MSRRIEVPPRDTTAPVRVPHKSSGPNHPKKRNSGIFNERHTSAQDQMYGDWVAQSTPLLFTFDDGTVTNGVLRGFDTYALSVEDAQGVPTLIFKQSLRMISPA